MRTQTSPARGLRGLFAGLLAAVAAAAALLASAVPAAAQNYVVRDANAGVVTFCSQVAGGANIPCHVWGGTTGTDYSANTPTLPNVGSAFGGSGPYAGYVLLTTIPKNQNRNCVYILNTSGAQIAVVTDDGTASSGGAPANASVFSLAGGSSAGAQGGATDPQFCAFKGRVQIYAPSSGAQVYAQVW